MALHWTEQQGLLHQEVLRSRGVVACATGEELLPQVASLAEEGKPPPLSSLLCDSGNYIDCITFNLTATGGNLQKELSDSPEINSDGVIGAIGLLQFCSLLVGSHLYFRLCYLCTT